MDTVLYNKEEKISLLRANGYVVREGKVFVVKDRIPIASRSSFAFKAGRKYDIDTVFDSTVKSLLLKMNPTGGGEEEEEEEGGFYTAGAGIDISGAVISLSHLGLENLTAPGEDKILFYDYSAEAVGWANFAEATSKLKISSNDTTPGYLEDKLALSYGGNVSEILELSTIGEGADETRILQIDESKISHDHIADVSADDHHSEVHNHAWSDITSGVPTTFAGYGISDTLASLNTALSDATLYEWEADQGAVNIHGDNVVYGSAASTACVGNDARLSDDRDPNSHAIGDITRHSGSTLAEINSLVSNNTLIGTDDARLSDARTPTAHASSHVSGGSDVIANFTSTVTGLVPLSGGGTTNYLRADGTWAAPPGSGGMVYPGAGIALSTGSAWGTSITNNSTEWNTAYSHSQDNTQAHSDYMLNTGDTASGTYNFDSNTLVVNHSTHRVGIGTNSPNTLLHIKADIPGVVGSHYAGQIIIQNPTDSVLSNVVITAYESDSSGNPDQQLWYLGSASVGNSDITFLNRRNAKLTLGTNDATRMTIGGDGKVGIGTGSPSYQLDVNGDVGIVGNIVLSGGFVPVIYGGGTWAIDTGAIGSGISIGADHSHRDNTFLTVNDSGYGGYETTVFAIGTYEGDGDPSYSPGTDDLFVVERAGIIRMNASLGIGTGTASPDYQFQVEKSSATDYVLADFRNISSDAGAYANIYLGNNAGTPYLQFRTSRSSGHALIGNPANQDLGFFTNGVANVRMTIKDAGNVGIGTVSPTELLMLRTASGSSTDLGLSEQGIGWRIRNDQGNNRLAISSVTSSSAELFDQFTERFTVLSDGKIGIGTASPDRYLHVYGGSAGTISANTNTQLVVENTGNAGLQFLSPNTANQYIMFGDPENTYDGYILYNHDSRKMILRSKATQTMTLHGANVGIGQSTPTSTLDIYTASGDATINLEGNAGHAILNLDAGGAGNDICIQYQDDGANKWLQKFESSDDSMFFYNYALGTNVITMLNSGYVGIGDTTPEYKLDVQTNHSSGFAGYFFNDGNNQNRYGIGIQCGQDALTISDLHPIRFFDGNGTFQAYIYFDNTAVDFGYLSDITLKENIKDYNIQGLDIIRQIQYRSFNWKSDKDKLEIHGWVADEVEEIYPEMASVDPETKYKTISPGRLMPVVMAGIRELDIKIESHEDKIIQLEKRVKKLEDEVELLKN